MFVVINKIVVNLLFLFLNVLCLFLLRVHNFLLKVLDLDFEILNNFDFVPSQNVHFSDALLMLNLN